MADVAVRTHIRAPVERVWEVLTDWEGQARWMADAQAVHVVSAHREGVGVRLRCPTDIAAGIVVTDEMVVDRWEEHRLIGVRHTGWLIKGGGAFTLRPSGTGTVMEWTESVDLPLGSLGELVGRAVIVPWVTRVFRRSLESLKRLCESAAVRP